MRNSTTDLLGARATIDTPFGPAYYYRLGKIAEDGYEGIDRFPFSIKVLLESLVRNCDGKAITGADVSRLASYDPSDPAREEIPYKPARVLLQDFTGVPAVVDLAALRSAMHRLGGNPDEINPRVPVNLVIDHSVQVDTFGSEAAFLINAEFEFKRNRERYEFLRWGQQAFDNFSVVPPARGIVHQVNLEYIARGVWSSTADDGLDILYPDSLVGTDSHTTMINGLGVVGWGVGGIEAEAVMLGQPIYMLMPEVVGFKLTGSLNEGVTATDLTLTVVQMLREKGVVGKFVEFYGEGMAHMTVEDRATIANMAPEYGATMGFFPVDDQTLDYLHRTGRPEALVGTVEAYCKAQGLFRTDDTDYPLFADSLELDLGDVAPSMAGPKRPQDRILLPEVQDLFNKALTAPAGPHGFGLEDTAVDSKGRYESDSTSFDMRHADVVIAAITSCTNTSNPSVMVGAGLVAKKAVERGLSVKPYVKTSLAPGSRVVTEYLREAGLLPYLDQLGFNLVGYGCTTCIGNSGPLPEPVANAVQDGDLVVAGVLSGNRNFEGRIHPLVKANFLASPPLVVAYALAGTVDIDLIKDPIGKDEFGNDVYLRDIWPTSEEIMDTIREVITPDLFRSQYAGIEESNDEWNEIRIPEGSIYEWSTESTYIQEPPFFLGLTKDRPETRSISGARVLVKVGDSTTTDHISPAGSIPADGPAGKYLQEHDVKVGDFNSFGSRRGNHEVMMRGTFANIRLRNEIAPGTEGGWTTYFPTGQVEPIYDAAMKYIESGTDLIVLAGREYGTGSSRDWAAKGTQLLGVRAVLAESFERIHRSNLVGMGVLPLQFKPGETPESLGLDGTETYEIPLTDEIEPQVEVEVTARKSDGRTVRFTMQSRLDTPVEVEYYQHGGILNFVLRDFLDQAAVTA